MKTPTLIGLTGLAGSGKDTVRGILEDTGFTGFAFADPIRQMLRELLTSNGIDSAYMDDRALKEAEIPALGVSYRHMAQTLGTEWGRRCLGNDFWLRIAGAYMADISATADADPVPFVISDVRFNNEATWIRKRGGVIWRIDRPGTAPVRAHASETQMAFIDVDATISNSGSLHALRYEVCMALEGVKP